MPPGTMVGGTDMMDRDEARRGAEVIALRPAEVQRVDAERIGAIYARVGSATAECTIDRAVAILHRRLDALEVEGRAGALRVVGLAEGVGLLTLAHCARAAAEAANSGDPVAEAATRARLRRAGTGALQLVGEGPSRPVA